MMNMLHISSNQHHHDHKDIIYTKKYESIKWTIFFIITDTYDPATRSSIETFNEDTHDIL